MSGVLNFTFLNSFSIAGNVRKANCFGDFGDSVRVVINFDREQSNHFQFSIRATLCYLAVNSELRDSPEFCISKKSLTFAQKF
jgi:hypothetical protein